MGELRCRYREIESWSLELIIQAYTNGGINCIWLEDQDGTVYDGDQRTMIKTDTLLPGLRSSVSIHMSGFPLALAMSPLANLTENCWIHSPALHCYCDQ